MANTQDKIRAKEFYNEYYGHKVSHLRRLYPKLRKGCDSLVWTAGDSTLDNKYWFRDVRPAVESYFDALDPPQSNADVTYWLNILFEERLISAFSSPSIKRAAINTAVEATTLNERTFRLRPQDRFIRDNIQQSDVLIVSIGGNDIALAPLLCTAVSILSLSCFSRSVIENSCVAWTIPADDCCCGCGASLLSCTGACPPCLGYATHLFGTRVQKYIERLTSKTKPKKVLVCMVYYLDESPTPSWAGPALSLLGYDRNPEQLQTLIRKIFSEATSKISIPGTEVIPVPLFNALDGKNPDDYVARVEPSSRGGRKLAEYLVDMIDHGNAATCALSPPPRAVEAQLMINRA